MTMPKTNAKEVKIRMYRQGLGDCFLLSFPRTPNPFHFLIDCGAFASKHYDDSLMNDVVNDIKETTGGHLDVLAATHEHWDHISGFTQAKKVFDKIKVDKVWVVWTEEPDSAAAKVLKDRFKKQKQAVEMALRRMPKSAQTSRLGLYKQAITELFGFFGGLGAKGGKGKTEEAWDYILNKGKKVYCNPKKDPLELEGVNGVRVYVLGPPEDPEYIKRLLSKKETYDTSFQALSLTDSFLAAVSGDDADPKLKEHTMPFDRRYCIPPREAERRDFFQKRYGFDAGSSDKWRRIEDDWLVAAGELALYLDSYTNNTCLALAIELIDSGKVLLFPGDAQVGNWLSWGDLSWQVKGDNGATRNIKIDDLLKRTVLYKVGHHGSHNATLRAKGLEIMESQSLVAMIPVHRATAKDQKWKFPYQPLWDRLKEKCGGRVLLADADNMDEIKDDVEAKLSLADWESLKKATTSKDLYIEYRIAI
jgi:hypothetical protein